MMPFIFRPYLRPLTSFTIGVGDSENDHAFCAHASCGIAVANALPALKEPGRLRHGASPRKESPSLIDQLLANNFQPGSG